MSLGITSTAAQRRQTAFLEAPLVPSRTPRRATECPRDLFLLRPSLIDQTDHRMRFGHAVAQCVLGNDNARDHLHHVQEHLWNLAAELHGRGTEAAQAWGRPFLQWLERRQNGALDVIEGLQQMRATLEPITGSQREALDREINYFEEHKHRMDYKAGKAQGQPVGSGAIESTCSQYQRRFKLTGQFWSLAGDEAFLSLDTLHRNNRWSHLFPHDSE